MISATVLHDVAAATSKEAFFASAAAATWGKRGVCCCHGRSLEGVGLGKRPCLEI